MKTKIIATIGPASLDPRIIKQLIDAGLNIARINTKYGSTKQYQQIAENIKRFDHLAIMYDIKGDDALPFLQTQKFSYLAVSFAETAGQINNYRKIFPRHVKIIAKIETQRGIDNLQELIAAADGIMVARGDLSKHIPPAEMPIRQKDIIKKCNEKNKFVVTATEMLLSMVKSTTPEQAEVSDIANAVLDGSDAVMLSEETAIGRHPVLAVKTMIEIVHQTEAKKYLLK